MSKPHHGRSGFNVVRLSSLLAIAAIISSGCDDAPQPSPQEGAEPVDTAGSTEIDSQSNAVALALDGEGLRVFLISSGSARPLPFGIPSSELIETLTRVLGSSPVSTGENADCAARFIEWPRGLTTWVTRDRFAGWSVRENSDLTTPSGIGVGATRSQLQDVYAAEIRTTSLGEEFTAGGLAGLLDSSGDSARISHLWAGATCIAR